MTASAEIRQQIEAAIEELEADIVKLRAAAQALGEEGVLARPARRTRTDTVPPSEAEEQIASALDPLVAS